MYNIKTSRGPTHCFTATPYDIQNEIYKARKEIEKIEINVESNKNKLKSMVVSVYQLCLITILRLTFLQGFFKFQQEANKPPLEREKLLVWQKFIADPDALIYRYKELEQMRDHC